MNSLLRQNLRWQLIAYAVGALVLRLLYEYANRLFRTGGASGIDLSSLWWFLAALYFGADAILLTTVIVRKPQARKGLSQKRSFLHYSSEVIPSVFMLHLAYLTFEYRISSRLEQVGLGILETIIYLGAMVVIAAWIFRSFENHETLETSWLNQAAETTK
jgi:hypothetical protein